MTVNRDIQVMRYLYFFIVVRWIANNRNIIIIIFFVLNIQYALLVTSCWLVDLAPMRDVLKYAMTISGVQSAMMDGMRLMPV